MGIGSSTPAARCVVCLVIFLLAATLISVDSARSQTRAPEERVIAANAARLAYARASRSGGRGRAVFEETVRLLRTGFVHDFDESRRFGDAVRKLTFSALPQCVEGIVSFEDCSDDPAECFYRSAAEIAERCGLPTDELVTRGLNLLLHDLDPYSGLMDARMIKELRISTSGRFGGLGLVVGARNGRYVVISSFDGSPAREAGVRTGDEILRIDGESIQGIPLMEVLAKVRGRPGARVTLRVRSGESRSIRDLIFHRKIIRIPPVESRFLDNGIGYLRIVNFQERTAREVKRALRRLREDAGGDLSGLILDLRDNPGGLFDQAIRTADLFLSRGTITQVRGKQRRFNKTFEASSRGAFTGFPIAILINKGTASAAEILAAALKQRPDVVLVGEPSFGKASVQGIFPVGLGMALRLTTAHYYTPAGDDIHGQGVTPDVSTAARGPRRTLGGPGAAARGRLDRDRGVRTAFERLTARGSGGRHFFPTWY